MRTLASLFVPWLLIVSPAVRAQTSGLTATPNPLNFNVPGGSGPSSQVLNVTFNGSPVTITTVSSSTSTGQNWLQASFSVPGALIAQINPLGLAAGSYSGSVVVFTTVGAITVAVNLTVGATPPVTPAPPSWILFLTGLAAVGLYRMRRILLRTRIV